MQWEILMLWFKLLWCMSTTSWLKVSMFVQTCVLFWFRCLYYTIMPCTKFENSWPIRFLGFIWEGSTLLGNYIGCGGCILERWNSHSRDVWGVFCNFPSRYVCQSQIETMGSSELHRSYPTQLNNMTYCRFWRLLFLKWWRSSELRASFEGSDCGSKSR